jgi:hypothetical protein
MEMLLWKSIHPVRDVIHEGEKKTFRNDDDNDRNEIQGHSDNLNFFSFIKKNTILFLPWCYVCGFIPIIIVGKG